MEKRARGRPRTRSADQKRESARDRQQERRRRLAEDGGRSISLAVPGKLLEAIDEEASRRGISRSAWLIDCARAEVAGSEVSSPSGSLDQKVEIHGSESSSFDPTASSSRTEHPAHFGPVDPRPVIPESADSHPEVAGSEVSSPSGSLDQEVEIHGSESSSFDPTASSSRTEHHAHSGSVDPRPVIVGSEPWPPRYRGRALLISAAVGAVFGSWLTLLLSCS